MISLSNVIGVTLLMWLVFALVGMTYLKGRFWACSYRAMAGIDECIGTYIGDGGLIAEMKWYVSTKFIIFPPQRVSLT